MIHINKIKHGEDLIYLLCRHPNDFISTSVILNKLQISRRTFYYVVKAVNQVLEENNLDSVINIKRLGYRLPETTIKALSSQMNNQDYKLTKINLPTSTIRPDDRIVILTFLMMSQFPFTLHQLTNLFHLSKTTILSDLKKVKSSLPTELTITTNRIIIGNELIIRKYILEHINALHKVIQLNFKPTLNLSKWLTRFEQITGNKLSPAAKFNLTSFLTWYSYRVTESKTLLNEFVSNQNNTLPVAWATQFTNELEINNQFEIQFLAQLTQTSQFNLVRPDKNLSQSLIPVVNQMIASWQRYYPNYKNLDWNKFRTDLITHLIPTYYRIKYDIKYDNPIVNNIMTDYRHTFQLTAQIIAPFEQFVHHSLSDDEIALISVYFGGLIRQNQPVLTQNSVLVVCLSGIGTSNLLYQQLHQNFPSVNFVGPYNTMESEFIDWTHIVGIISTLEINFNQKIPTMTVSALPSENDFQRISQFLSNISATNHEATTIDYEAMLDVISEYARIERPTQLKKALRQFLTQSNSHRPKNIIEDYYALNPQFIQVINKTPLNWKNALNIAFSPLINDNCISLEYVEKIIRSSIDHKDYMAIGNGIFLAHGRPTDGVNHFGIGISTFPNGFLSYSGNEIKMIITLAPTDDRLQESFLESIMKYLTEENWLHNLYQINNKNELITYLEHYHLVE